MTFVFLGAYSEVLGANLKLTRFGQRVDLPAEIADDTRRDGGLICIPAEAFDALGFTQAELDAYPTPASHANAEFQDKKRRALDILHELRSAKEAQ